MLDMNLRLYASSFMSGMSLMYVSTVRDRTKNIYRPNIGSYYPTTLRIMLLDIHITYRTYLIERLDIRTNYMRTI